MKLEDYIVSAGISSRIDISSKLYFHIFAISKDNKKVYFCGDYWDEDIKNKVESTDFNFVFDEFVNTFKDNDIKNTLLASFLF